jgi:enamine deaminase RidA (YjgF/YER057c/UK114 family)
MAELKAVNPWTWQEAFGFAQAVEVRGGQRVLYCSGQTSVDGEGQLLHAGNMAAQVTQALDNLETVLRKAGLTLRHVVRLNYYTTDVSAFMTAAGDVLPARLGPVVPKPSGTLLGVARLFHPDALVEIEATAVE